MVTIRARRSAYLPVYLNWSNSIVLPHLLSVSLESVIAYFVIGHTSLWANYEEHKFSDHILDRVLFLNNYISRLTYYKH